MPNSPSHISNANVYGNFDLNSENKLRPAINKCDQYVYNKTKYFRLS